MKNTMQRIIIVKRNHVLIQWYVLYVLSGAVFTMSFNKTRGLSAYIARWLLELWQILYDRHPWLILIIIT